MKIAQFQKCMKTLRSYKSLVDTDFKFVKKNFSILTNRQVGMIFKKLCLAGAKTVTPDVNIFHDVFTWISHKHDTTYPPAPGDPYLNYVFYHPSEAEYRNKKLPAGFGISFDYGDQISKLPAGVMALSCNHFMDDTCVCDSSDLLTILTNLQKYIDDAYKKLNETNQINKKLMQNNSKKVLNKVGL